MVTNAVLKLLNTLTFSKAGLENPYRANAGKLVITGKFVTLFSKVFTAMSD
jgi:hypothetical protein